MDMCKTWQSFPPVGYSLGIKDTTQKPSIRDKIHCVAFVVDANGVTLMGDSLSDKICKIREQANKRYLNPIIILTRIDKICTETAKDTTKVYHSRIVRQKVEEVGLKFGIPENMIFPLRNYCKEIEKELGIDILTLRTLRQILRSSKGFLGVK
eukprot:TRINITY_DN25603_c0_g1_i1.p1 TRINITY_DN25603_c0_g1~~TRINITY_DN25603_c0_g1_i1.p1  ORF type:complete len:161 (-),score=30.31 TRINITY_DN25603_c0_g1_i1:107-565(-)